MVSTQSCGPVRATMPARWVGQWTWDIELVWMAATGSSSGRGAAA
jgi:hypothetical protein